MSSFLYELGQHCFRHRWRVLATWVLVLAVLGGLAGLISKPLADSFSIPGAQSQKALDQLQMNFPQAAGTTATMIVVVPEGISVENAAVKRAVEAEISRLDDMRVVDGVTSPWDEHVSGLIADEEGAAIVNVRLNLEAPSITEGVRDELQQHARDLQERIPGSRVSMGGEAFSIDVPTMSVTELFGVGAAMIVLLITLGSLVAAGMPLLTALVGVGLTMAVLFLATAFADINTTTPMLAVMLGLAVGIDYALFIVSRHRELLASGLSAEEAGPRATATAGSAVVFAGLTVVIALVGLGVAGIPFLTVMGVFAALGVAIAVLIALTLLPALMGLAGERLRPRVRKPRSSKRAATRERTSASAWWVRTVTRVPILTVVVVLAGSIALTVPAKDLWLALPNSGRHETTQPDRITYDLVSEHFGPGFNGPLIVTADIIGSDDPLGVMDGIKADVEKLPGVASVPVSTPNENADTGMVQVVPTTGPDDPRTKDLVLALRDLAPQWQERYDVDTAVTGATAVQIDISDKLAKALLPFGIFVVGLSLVLLTIVFRSIWVPLKASIGYLLSVGVAFGMTALVFNKGFARQVINLEEPGPIISFLPILLMGILFGLAMDYEVFLVSRMREEHVHGKGAREAVKAGFVGSAPVVVAAALIMFLVFAFFVPEGSGPIKPIAFALAIGVAFDAFVVRMTLVPAVMHLLGERAWWLPRSWEKRLPVFDVEGEGIARQLQLAAWPETPRPTLVYAEGLAVDGLLEPLDVTVHPGEVVVVEAAPSVRAATLFTLAGRLRADAGRGRVAGALLNEQGAAVRRRSVVVDVASTHDVSADLRAALRRPTPLVVIDGADALHTREEREVLDQLVAAIAGSEDRALLLGAVDARHLDLSVDAAVLRPTAPTLASAKGSS